MDITKTLEERNREVSSKLLDSLYLLELLEEMLAENAKMSTVVSIITNNVKSSFDEISECRSMIS